MLLKEALHLVVGLILDPFFSLLGILGAPLHAGFPGVHEFLKKKEIRWIFQTPSTGCTVRSVAQFCHLLSYKVLLQACTAEVPAFQPAEF